MEKMIMVRFKPEEKSLLQVACIQNGISLASLFRAVAGIITRHNSKRLEGFDKSLAMRIITLSKEEKKGK